MLTINKNVSGDKMTVLLEGRLDTVTAPDLQKELDASLDGINELVLDFEKVEYISSAGLRVLVAVHPIMAKRNGMKLIHVNDTIMKIFTVTGLSNLLVIEWG
ncbi:MAG: STAS domain-containing protein [Eubacteriales bacterium]|nr:STAS domain-containing protein [Eubacteriales bacterium]